MVRVGYWYLELLLVLKKRINKKKNLFRKRKKIIFCNSPLCPMALLPLCKKNACCWALQEAGSLPPHCSWSPWVTNTDTGGKPTGGVCVCGGGWDRMLIRTQSAEVNRESLQMCTRTGLS